MITYRPSLRVCPYLSLPSQVLPYITTTCCLFETFNQCAVSICSIFGFCYLCVFIILPLCSGGSSDIVKTFEDIETFRVATGASSVMIARAAMWNPSVFRQQGALPVDTVMEEYIKYVSGTTFVYVLSSAISYLNNK